MSSPSTIIDLVLCVSPSPDIEDDVTSADDRALIGEYESQICGDPQLLSALTAAQMVELVLREFHDSHGVDHVDDLVLSVRARAGRYLECDDHDFLGWDPAVSVTLGEVTEQVVPDAPRSTVKRHGIL